MEINQDQIQAQLQAQGFHAIPLLTHQIQIKTVNNESLRLEMKQKIRMLCPAVKIG